MSFRSPRSRTTVVWHVSVPGINEHVASEQKRMECTARTGATETATPSGGFPATAAQGLERNPELTKTANSKVRFFSRLEVACYCYCFFC